MAVEGVWMMYIKSIIRQIPFGCVREPIAWWYNHAVNLLNKLFCINVKLQNGPESWRSLILPFAALILVLCILDYYVESVSINHLEVFRTARFSGYSLFLSGLVLSYIWGSSYNAGGSILGRVGEFRMEDHALTGGVIFSAILFIWGKSGTGCFTPRDICNLQNAFVEDFILPCKCVIWVYTIFY